MSKLKKFLEAGGKLIFGDAEQIRMLKEDLVAKYKQVHYDEKLEVKARCPFCNHRSYDWYDEDDSDTAIDDMSCSMVPPKGLENTKLQNESFYKCDKCKQIFYS